MKRVVVAGANHWGGPVTTGSHQYAREFAEHGWEVAYLSDPLSPLHPLRRKSWVYNRDKFRLWMTGGRRHLGGALFAYNHFTLLPIFNAPLLRSRLAVRRSLDLSLPNLTRKLGAEGFDKPELLWIEHITFHGLVDRLRPRGVIYRMADDPALFPDPYPPAMLAELPRLVARADLLIATARRLQERVRRQRQGPVLYLPNGVDFEHFAAPHPEPVDLREIPRPRILYVGSLEEWFDTELMRRTAEAHPSYQFIVVGPARVPLEALRRMQNVHVLGPRPYEAVAAFMAHADAGLIPFRVTPAMEAVHPIKVYEYLAAGLPVVSTGWEELRLMEAPIAIAGSASEFVAMVEAAVTLPDDPAPRQAYACRNSWRARFESLEPILNETLRS